MGKISNSSINYGNSFVVSTQSSRLTEDEIKQARQIAEKLVEDAKQKALVIEAQAQTNAQKIIEEAQTQANAQVNDITETARKQGYEEGYSAGFESISRESQEKIINLDEFAKSNFEFKKRIIKSMHTEILDLVIAIARKVCSDELRQNPALLEKLVLGAISQLKEKEEVTIIVNPVMAQKIYEISDALTETVKTLENVRIVEDNSVSSDGTIVESVGSRVDARLCAQIDKIAAQLYDELNSIDEEELIRETEDESDEV